ncbi:DUF4157 domain-containing protein [Deinococcus sp.]|uniref:eCIS core domain-containing protein n=1 Tax=Deinococcus sp. TaxID=47478 RepID=UPI0025B835BC|nr:DUF4157 domain-containing protein [Deinococcus sp.]
MTERSQQGRRTVPLPVQPVLQLPEPPPLTSLEAQRHTLQRFTARPQTAQRQAAAPVLRAASLDRQEQDRLTGERTSLQRQIATLGKAAPAQQPAQPPVPVKPVTPSDWVTVMRHRAEGVEGQRLDTRAFGEFQTLQRQVAQTLAHSFRSDRGESQARYATYGEHLATLQRHALSAPVSRVVLGMVPPSERLPLQRATDEALQRQRAQEQAALNFGTLQTLQRQLAELDAEATQPVLQRIQARRGAGNPLPEAIQRHLEGGLNHDLSRVRIHDDAEADKLAKGVNAVAFTTGTDIFFQAGQFNPNTQSGLELLAHEVTHTVQQARGEIGPGIDPSISHEVQARDMGRHLAALPMHIDQQPKHDRPVKNIHVIGKQKHLGLPMRSLSIQRALPVVAVWIGKTVITGSIDNFIDYAISVLLGLPAPGFWDKAGNFAINAIPGVGEAKKAGKLSELSAAVVKLLNALHELENLGDAGKSAAALIRKRSAAFESAAKSGNLGTAQAAWNGLVESIQNGHLTKGRQLNLSVFQSWATSGLSVVGQTFKINPHFLNTLKKGGRKDITPNDVLGALRTKPSARTVINDVPSVTYTNPETGLKVHVNPDTTELVGVWPGDFK